MVAEALSVKTNLQGQIFHSESIQGQKKLPGEQAAYRWGRYQYSEASITVSTRCVRPSLAGFSLPAVRFGL